MDTEPIWTNAWETEYINSLPPEVRKGFKGIIKQPMGFGAELFESEFCPVCQRTYRFYSTAQAGTHYQRTHKDPKHWAYVK